LTHIELDELNWQANWTHTETEELREKLKRACDDAGDWVLDGTNRRVRDEVLRQAEVVVWLDYSASLMFIRLLKRTLSRVLFARRLWNGNIESWRSVLSTNSVLIWYWRMLRPARAEFAAMHASRIAHGMATLRFNTPQQADAWLASMQRFAQTQRIK
jgi:adenylate kinase family enzyme